MQRARGKPARMHYGIRAPRATVLCSLRSPDRKRPRRPQHAPLYRRARACPSLCCVNRKIAGDRPPRYGSQNDLAYRRARACPSPCNEREGNPLGCASGIRGPPRYGNIETRRSLLPGRHQLMKHPHLVTVSLETYKGQSHQKKPECESLVGFHH